MAVDDYDIVIPPDYGDHLCLDCVRALTPEHPDWLDPEDDDSNMTPIFDTTEVSYLITCGRCGCISTIGSFGPEAVDYGIELIELAVAEGRRSEYLDTYADRLRWCILGKDDAEENERTTLLERYKSQPIEQEV